MTDETTQAGATELTPEVAAELRGAQRIARFVGLFLPLALTGVLAVLLAVWLPRMPAEAAVHWDAAGTPDGFTSPMLNAVMLPLVCLLLTSMYFLGGLQHLQARARGRAHSGQAWGAMDRLLPAIVLGAVAGGVTLALMITVPQLGLASGTELPQNPWVGASMLMALPVTAVAYFVQPRFTLSPQGANRAGEPIALADTERVAWFGEVPPSRAYFWFAIGSMAALLAAGLLPLILGGLNAVYLGFIWSCVLVIGFLLASSARVHVRIDERGLEMRSVMGWPRLRVPAADITDARVSETHPFAEFGGWGWRIATDGRVGIVMRAGPSLRVSRRTKKDIVITIDDTEAAAGVLAAVVSSAAAADTTPNTKEP